MPMQLILTQDVTNLGKAGELVTVKSGFGRNYLVPRGLALTASKQNMAELEANQRRIAARAAKVAKEVKAVMALEVLLEFILTTTVQMETFGIVLFRRVQQEQVVLVAMAVLEATEERAEVFKLRVLQKLVTVVPEALVVLEEPEEREAMEPTE